MAPPRLLLMIMLLTAAGCSQRQLTEQDCAAVRTRIEAAWLADANEAAVAAKAGQVRRFVKDEAGRIGARWMEQCRAMVGRELDEDELNCLLKAERIDDVVRCAP